MKRRALSLAAVAGFALLAFSLVTLAQPVTTGGGGLSRVTVTGGGLAGSGTTSNPLKVRSDCADGEVLKSTSGAWGCAADSAGTGDIEAVTAGNGLTGGGTSGGVTLDIGAGTNIAINADDVALAPNVTIGGLLSIPNGSTTVSEFRGTEISPAALGASQDDWNPTGLDTATVVRVEASVAGLEITGLAGTAGNRFLRLINVGATHAISLAHQSSSSSAAQRFITIGGAIFSLDPGDWADLYYDATTSRWRVLSAGGGSGDITEVTTAAASGLTGGATSGAVALSVRTDCAAYQTISWDGDSWECVNGPIPSDKGWSLHEEFSDCNTTVSDWQGFASGAGSMVSDTSGESNHPTICRVETGTTTTGRASLTYEDDSTLNVLEFGGGEIVGEISIKPTTLCDAVTDVCVIRCGFLDDVTAESTHAAYFKYNPAASSNWRVFTSDGVATTEQDTSPATAPTASTWTTLRIEVNAAATSVTFKIDGASVGTLSTNVPSGDGEELSFGCYVHKSAGANSRGVWLDYADIRQVFTSAR